VSDPDRILPITASARRTTGAALRRPAARADDRGAPRHPAHHQAEPQPGAQGADREGVHRQPHRHADRRQRLLYTTPAGHDLAVKLAKLQTRRILRALAELDTDGKEAVSRYLLRLIDPDDRDHVARLVFGGSET
jgi:hypothetical protein